MSLVDIAGSAALRRLVSENWTSVTCLVTPSECTTSVAAPARDVVFLEYYLERGHLGAFCSCRCCPREQRSPCVRKPSIRSAVMF